MMMSREESDMNARQPVLIRTIAEMRQALRPYRGTTGRIGLVPTMGALHQAHASLMRRCRGDCSLVVVSVYVNPTQFGPNEDFGKYPRQLQADLEVCTAEGVDFVFAPSDKEMYGEGSLTKIHVDRLTEGLCGAVRPGHFDGVCTVVAKLFNIVQPDAAYFGQKDAQQVAVLQRMVADLNIPTEIVVCPLVREADGLAMSSRNKYLSPEQRRQALCLSQALQAGCQAIREGHRNSDAIAAIMRQKIRQTGDFPIDYLAAYDARTLEPLAEVRGRVLLAGAIRLGQTRLIDNMVMEVQ